MEQRTDPLVKKAGTNTAPATLGARKNSAFLVPEIESCIQSLY